MADQKKNQQNNPNRQNEENEESQDTQATRPNREGSQTGTGSERQAQPARTGENVQESGTRKTEQGI